MANTASTRTSAQTAPSVIPAQDAPEASQPSRRGRSRRTATTRFKGFDSDDDDKPATLHSVPEAMVLDDHPAVDSQSQGLFLTQDPEMELYHRAPPTQPETQTRSSRKRPPPVEYELDSDRDIMEEVAPAATAFKKQRRAEMRARGESTPPLPVVTPEPLKQEPSSQSRTMKKIKKAEVDILEVARKKREDLEELRRAEREAEQEALGGIDVTGLRDLAIVEEMDIKRPIRPVRVSRADESDRWDDRWNGRKDFKQFRRRGVENRRRPLERIIVPLEEVKKKDYGVGDDYWLEQTTSRSQSKKKKNRSQRQESQARRQPMPDIEEEEEEETNDIDEDLMDEEFGAVIEQREYHPINLLPPPKAIAAQKTQSQAKKLVDKTSEAKNLPSVKKRPAQTTLTKPAPVKKVKAAAVAVQDSDDSEDETKFRFRKR